MKDYDLHLRVCEASVRRLRDAIRDRDDLIVSLKDNKQMDDEQIVDLKIQNGRHERLMLVVEELYRNHKDVESYKRYKEAQHNIGI